MSESDAHLTLEMEYPDLSLEEILEKIKARDRVFKRHKTREAEWLAFAVRNGATQRDIADALDVSPSTAYVRIHKAGIVYGKREVISP